MSYLDLTIMLSAGYIFKSGNFDNQMCRHNQTIVFGAHRSVTLLHVFYLHNNNFNLITNRRINMQLFFVCCGRKNMILLKGTITRIDIYLH